MNGYSTGVSSHSSDFIKINDRSIFGLFIHGTSTIKIEMKYHCIDEICFYIEW